MSEDADRQRVLAEARTWIGTPFHDVAGIKGVGVDCAHLLARVYADVGLIEPFDPEPYSPQFFLHRSEELFLATVGRFAREVSQSEAKPADIIVYKIGRCYAHGAIVIDYPATVIHAFKSAGKVVMSHAEEGELSGRDRRFFSLWGR